MLLRTTGFVSKDLLSTETHKVNFANLLCDNKPFIIATCYLQTTCMRVGYCIFGPKLARSMDRVQEQKPSGLLREKLMLAPRSLKAFPSSGYQMLHD